MWLSHCPCTHEVACQLWLSVLCIACCRSFYFKSVFPLCKRAKKCRPCLHLSFQYFPLKSDHKRCDAIWNALLFPTWGLKMSTGCALLFVLWIHLKDSLFVTDVTQNITFLPKWMIPVHWTIFTNHIAFNTKQLKEVHYCCWSREGSNISIYLYIYIHLISP